MSGEGTPNGFEHQVRDFLAYLELERGLSRNTLDAYRTDLNQFGEWLGAQGADHLTSRHRELAGFLDAAREAGWKVTHVISAHAGPGARVALILPGPTAEEAPAGTPTEAEGATVAHGA